jgi:hypothetical protein
MLHCGISVKFDLQNVQPTASLHAMLVMSPEPQCRMLINKLEPQDVLACERLQSNRNK